MASVSSCFTCSMNLLLVILKLHHRKSQDKTDACLPSKTDFFEYLNLHIAPAPQSTAQLSLDVLLHMDSSGGLYYPMLNCSYAKLNVAYIKYLVRAFL